MNNMKLLLLMIGVLIYPTRGVIKNELQANVVRLTENLFSNLQEDPRLKDKIISDSTKSFIDKQVTNYMTLITQTHGLIEHSVTRRSLPIKDTTRLAKDNVGVYVLDGFIPRFNIKAEFPKDMVLFEHEHDGNLVWYAAVLECKSKSTADDLVVYKMIDSTFVEINRVPVINGVKLGVHSSPKSTFIVVAENNAISSSFHEETGIYEFSIDEVLIKIQSLDSDYASDVAIWGENEETFLIIAQHIINGSEKASYEVDTPIYKWLGKHFDIINHITTYGARRVTPFVIGNSHFLAVANFQNNFGSTNIYSEIFKYDLHTEQFQSYQKILTRAAVDVKYFCFMQNNIKENFLVFANLFDIEADGSKNYETDSIIYKYVDDYFIPFQSFKLNGAMEWLPVIGKNGEFVLLAACKFEGIKAFQYDGWKFVESEVQYTDEAFSKGVVSMRSYLFNDTPIIVVANENDRGNMMNLFEPTFTHRNMLKQFHDDMLAWCKQSIESFQSVDLQTIGKDVEDAPKHDDAILQLPQGVTFSNLTVENLQTLDPNATDSEPTEEEDELQKLVKEVDAYSKELSQMDKQMRLSLHTTNTSVFQGDLHVKKLVLNNSETTLESINAKTINDLAVSTILGNVININKGFRVFSPLEFDNITIENKFFPTFINDQPADAVLKGKRSYDVVINGNASFKDGLEMDGKLNGIHFTKENVLLSQGNQTFGNLEVDILATEKLDAKFINNIDMLETVTSSVLVESIEKLTVKTVIIGGLINQVDMPTLNAAALKTFGSQTITAEYTFDSLYVDNIDVKSISGKKIPEDLVLTNGGDYRINHDVQFLGDFNVNQLFVNERLNNIEVINGQLDVLLVDVPDVQHIIGLKDFGNVELLSPINLQGRINGSRLEKMNPVATIDEELVLVGDYIIAGDVKIEDFIQTDDLHSSKPADNSNSVLSIKRLRDKGLKVTEDTIPVHLNFTQQLHVQDVVADKINDIEVNSLVVAGSNEVQIISGWKKFLGDVHIVGSTNVTTINGINLQNLESNILQINGLQTLSGKYHFENIVANRITNVKTEFGDKLWENVMTTHGDQTVAGTTLISDSIQVQKLQANAISCKQINGFDFTALINDTVYRDQNVVIEGDKTFLVLTVENLNVPTIDLDLLPKVIEGANGTFQYDEDIELLQDIEIENILFNDRFNDVPAESFGRQWLTTTSDQVITTDQNFGKITIFGNLLIESGQINGVAIKDINENSIKIDEPFQFQTATFTNGLASQTGVHLQGQFESLDLNDIVLSHTKLEQVLLDQITFHGDVTIFGEVFFNGLISGVNLSQICTFILPVANEDPINLHINGNVYFTMGPEVYYINNHAVRDIINNVWFTNHEALITGVLEFDQVLFQEDIIVDGFVDDIKLELVAKTYFSKTHDQNITALLDFEGGVSFGGGVYANEATVDGDVGEININEFVRTAILDNYDQIFEDALYLEECEILELHGEYLVNDLNLETDVMRYDQNNIVTGTKSIRDVETYTLKMERAVSVQHIDILWWLQHAVLKTGTFRIGRRTVFQNTTSFEEIGCQRLINDMDFNLITVMLKSFPQKITAEKTFTGSKSTTLRFRSMNLRGLIGDINLPLLLHTQALRTGDTVFKTPFIILSNITTPNVIVEKLYHGVNVSQLIYNITHFATINNYYESYEKLLNSSYKIRESLKAQAYFLDYYQVRQIYQSIDFVIPVKFDDVQYLACIMKGVHNYSIEFDVWDNVGEYFHGESEVSMIQSKKQLHNLKAISYRGTEHWYIEHENDDQEIASPVLNRYEGSIYKVTREGLIKILPSILHNGTQSVESLIIPADNQIIQCILALFKENAVVYCETLAHNGEIYLNIYQSFPAYTGIEAISSVIEGTSYIFIINAGTVQEQPSVDIWKFDPPSKYFIMDQMIYVARPNGITTISCHGNHYLAIASGHIQTAKDAGLLHIRKFDADSKKFTAWQDINISAPLQIKFVELPTRELVLYVITDNPTEPLMVYEYAGISGFKQKVVGSTVPKTMSMRSFTTSDKKHFILAQNENEIRVIQALFKGDKYEF